MPRSKPSMHDIDEDGEGDEEGPDEGKSMSWRHHAVPPAAPRRVMPAARVGCRRSAPVRRDAAARAISRSM